jgi:hypothetical protein
MDHLWSPGESGNPNGRPIGARNRRTKEIINQIISSGNQDPLLTLSDLQAKSTDEGIRATAANMLAPFMHSKLTATPAPRYIENPVVFPHPHPTTVDQVNENIAHLKQELAADRLDLDFYNALLAGEYAHIATFKAREDVPENTTIHITGGLPPLPGCEIIMPDTPTLNGHETNIICPPQAPLLPEQDPDTPPVIPNE